MALDYVIDTDCEVKRQLSLGGMVSLIKKRNTALAYIDIFKKEGKTDDEIQNSTVEQRFQTPEGVQVTRQTISGMLGEVKILDELKTHCRSCKANSHVIAAEACRTNDFSAVAEGQGYRCYGTINYPISGKAEGWLIEASKRALEKGRPNTAILDIIADKKPPADSIKRMRARTGMNFFELKKPLEIVAGKGLFGNKTVNTDQLLFMLFGFDRLGQDHMMALLYFSGGITDLSDASKSKAGCIKLNMNGRERAFSLTIDESDDRSIGQIKTYFWSLMVACLLNEDVLVCT